MGAKLPPRSEMGGKTQEFFREARSPAMLFIWGSGEGPDDTLTAVSGGGAWGPSPANTDAGPLRKVGNPPRAPTRRVPAENIPLGRVAPCGLSTWGLVAS